MRRTRRSYRGIPLRTALVSRLVDQVRPAVATLDADDIAAVRARTIPQRPPFSWVTGRPVRSVRITSATAPARDGYAVPLRVYHPSGPTGARPVVLYFHGGGWVLGNPADYDPLCTRVSALADVVVVSVDYRKAPEHRAPQAALDAVDVALWVADHAAELGGDGSRLGVMGDSAGGNLAAVVAQVFRDLERTELRSQVLIYPATDLTMGSASVTEHAHGAILDRPAMDAFLAHYCPPGTDLRDPLLSPLFGSLERLAPALVITADLDPIRDDGVRYAEALEAAGVDVEWLNYEGMPHGFASMSGATPRRSHIHGPVLAHLARHLRG